MRGAQLGESVDERGCSFGPARATAWGDDLAEGGGGDGVPKWGLRRGESAVDVDEAGEGGCGEGFGLSGNGRGVRRGGTPL